MRGRGTLFRLVLYPGDDEMKENLHELLKNWGLEGRTIQEAKDTGAAIATGVWHLGPDYSLKTGGNLKVSGITFIFPACWPIRESRPPALFPRWTARTFLAAAIIIL